MNHMRSVHLLVQGKVQGVFFRATAKDVAESLQLTGWVKNTAGGEVELQACGDVEKVQRFIDWCKKGPRGAIVTGMEVMDTSDFSFNSFQVLRY
jgi:acylphosphatase